MPVASAIRAIARSAASSTSRSPAPSSPPRPIEMSAGTGTSTNRFVSPAGATVGSVALGMQT